MVLYSTSDLQTYWTLGACLGVYLLVMLPVSGIVQPNDTRDCICKEDDVICYCTLTIEHRLTMLFEENGAYKLAYPKDGTLFVDQDRELNETEMATVITADGQGSRLLIAINGQFPGPRIEAYVNQKLRVTVVNKLHTDSVTVHFHGLHQRETPWADGVAFISQCPILPGQTFVHEFKVFPPGSAMYHAHIGDQRSMGLYGPVVVHPRNVPLGEQIVITLQDWNHLMDPETGYQRMITEQFNLISRQSIPTTYSVDMANFSRFEFQSGLANGKGRYWQSINNHNGSPLERFKIQPNQIYRFRIIGAQTLYPMRVFIESSNLTLFGSDGFDLSNITVQSIVVHPGERYDFLWTSPGARYVGTHRLLTAQTIETSESLGNNKYHAAEVILDMNGENGSPNLNPVKATESCTPSSKCQVFNCPFGNYADSDNRICLTYNNVSNEDLLREPETIANIDREYFFNFAFPGPVGRTEGSVNGRQFVSPPVSMLTQPNEVTTLCNDESNNECTRIGVCSCTYTKKIPSNKVIQMVFMNLGKGKGWSHPVHLHGHSFYVMKMGLPTYDRTTGAIIAHNTDITCTDVFGYCNMAKWSNPEWAGGNIPDLNETPPQKDTIVVPTGNVHLLEWVLRYNVEKWEKTSLNIFDKSAVIPPPR